MGKNTNILILAGVALAGFYFFGKTPAAGGGSVASQIGEDIAKGMTDTVKGGVNVFVDEATGAAEAVNKTIYDTGYEHGKATRGWLEETSSNIEQWKEDTATWIGGLVFPKTDAYEDFREERQKELEKIAANLGIDVSEGINASIGGMTAKDFVDPKSLGSTIGTSNALIVSNVNKTTEPNTSPASIGTYTAPNVTKKSSGSGGGGIKPAKKATPIIVKRETPVFRDELGQGISADPAQMPITPKNILSVLGVKFPF